MSKLEEKREELKALQAQLEKIFEEAGPDLDLSKVTSISGDNSEKAAEIKRLNDKMAEVGKEVDDDLALQEAAQRTKELGEELKTPVNPMRHPVGGNGRPTAPVKSLGELFVASPAYKQFRGHEGPSVEFGEKDFGVELKTLFATTAGWAPESVRGPRVELTPERRLVVADLPSATTTGQAAIKYMEETTKTPAAAETAEAGTYPEAAFALTERSSTVRKIAVFIPITDEVFEDEGRARDYINNRLVRACRERLDSQLLVGNGVAPNLTGILNVSGIQTQAKGTDPTFDAIHKAITKVEFTGYAEPDAIVLHPNDWQDIKLTRTADGIYILGNPNEAGRPWLWGLPVVVTPAITENTGLVGAFRAYSEMAMRSDIELKVSDSHSTYFVEGKLAVRADFRVAFVVYRPLAFCTITGI